MVQVIFRNLFMGPMAVGEAAVHLPGYQGDELG